VKDKDKDKEIYDFDDDDFNETTDVCLKSSVELTSYWNQKIS